MGFLLYTCPFFSETWNDRAATVGNFAGDCDEDEKRMWGAVHWPFIVSTQKDMSAFFTHILIARTSPACL